MNENKPVPKFYKVNPKGKRPNYLSIKNVWLLKLEARHVLNTDLTVVNNLITAVTSDESRQMLEMHAIFRVVTTLVKESV